MTHGLTKGRLFGMIFVLTVLLLLGFRVQTGNKHRGQLRKAGMPDFFSEVEDQLEYLNLVGVDGGYHWLITPKLTHIVLKNCAPNQLERLPESLKVLELHQTDLTSLKGIEALHKLETVVLVNNNRLADLSALTELPVLRRLIIRQNGVTIPSNHLPEKLTWLL